MAVGWVCSVVAPGGTTAEIQMIATENVGMMGGARAVVVLMGEVVAVTLKVVVVRVKMMARAVGMVGVVMVYLVVIVGWNASGSVGLTTVLFRLLALLVVGVGEVGRRYIWRC